ncbi:hypothetical protein BD413DRAFT_161450 [Trametes elegans]|nr:hypothetical protein BD413DRAFT_161450 [Trametes elegans]
MQPQVDSRSNPGLRHSSEVTLARSEDRQPCSPVEISEVPAAKHDPQTQSSQRALIQANKSALDKPLKMRRIDPPAVVSPLGPLLGLTDLNRDVLEMMMALLPLQSLAALMETFRFFSEAAVRPLCRLSNRPFTCVPQVLSFVQFLGIGSAAPRFLFIRELHFAQSVVYWHAFSNRHGRILAIGSCGLFDSILQILRQCRNLRTVHFMCWEPDWKLEALAATIATLLWLAS